MFEFNDRFHNLLEAFTSKTGLAVPTVNLDDDELEELRSLLEAWDAGELVENKIRQLFAIEPGVES